jgi:phage baseplate assembly protein V
MTQTLGRALKPLKDRVMLMLARGVVKLVSDAGGLQQLQVGLLASETRGEVDRMQNYGTTSVPLAGAAAVLLFVGGNRDHPIAVAVDDPRYRPTGLKPGEVAHYTFDGSLIHLEAGGTIRVVAATKVRIESPLVEITGTLNVAGDVTDRDSALGGAGGNSMAGMRQIYDAHVHGGVVAGPAKTQTPQGQM